MPLFHGGWWCHCFMRVGGAAVSWELVVPLFQEGWWCHCFMGVGGATVSRGLVVPLFYGGWWNHCFMGVETMEFDIFIITQIVYLIVSFKSTSSSAFRAHMSHNSVPTSFAGVLCLQTNQHVKTGITMTTLHMAAVK